MSFASPHPLSVDLGPVMVTNHDGSEKIDLRLSLLELDIYESVFSPCMTATVVFNDSNAIRARFPMIGNERLEVSLRSPLESASVRIDGLVYRATPVSYNDRASVVALHAASRPLVNEPRRSVFRAYGRRSISESVRQVFEEFVAQDTTKSIEIEGPVGLHEFVFHGRGPLATIAWLAREAGTFLFFETTDGFRFVDVQTLMGAPAIETFWDAFANVSERERRISGNQVILSLKRTVVPDTLRNLSSGYLGGMAGYIDPLTKKFSEVSYDYSTNFADHKRLGPISKPVIGGDILDDVGAAVRYLVPTALDTRQHPYAPINDRLPRGASLESDSAVLLQLADTVRLEVMVPGYSRIRAGSVVDLRLPELAGDASALGQAARLESGLYLVLAVNHKISSDGRYVSVMDCARPSFPNSPVRVD